MNYIKILKKNVISMNLIQNAEKINKIKFKLKKILKLM